MPQETDPNFIQWLMGGGLTAIVADRYRQIRGIHKRIDKINNDKVVKDDCKDHREALVAQISTMRKDIKADFNRVFDKIDEVKRR